jgi:hypothetical protein
MFGALCNEGMNALDKGKMPSQSFASQFAGAW